MDFSNTAIEGEETTVSVCKVLNVKIVRKRVLVYAGWGRAWTLIHPRSGF